MLTKHLCFANFDTSVVEMSFQNSTMKQRNYFVLSLLLTILCSQSKSAEHIYLNQNWEFQQKGDSLWMPASVPGTVHTDLLANGKIEDPYFRLNEKDLQWIEKEDWNYRTTFTADDELLAQEKIELIFDGLDTYAEVLLNGKHLFNANNMHLQWKAEVKPLLKKGENLLQIYFESPINKVTPSYLALPYKVPVSDNDQGARRLSVFSRKAWYHYGWDWGPRLVTSGIWRPAYLHAWNKADITDLFIKQLKLTETSAELEAQLSVTSTEAELKTIQVYIDDEIIPIAKKQIQLKLGENKISLRFDLKNIKLWWPNGMGNPQMYRFKAVVSEYNEELSVKEVKKGLRTIELVNENNDKGKSFYFKVNGKPLFMKGANYIPQDNFITRVGAERYEHLIKSAVNSHMNMLRVAGVGVYENEIFYNLCDENGLLVWQDFMFAAGMLPPQDSLRKSIQSEAIYNVKRLRNHPCIAIWCGNNESLQFINQDFWRKKIPNEFTLKDSTTLYNFYYDIFNSDLPAVVKANDDEKFYWSSSPSNENYSETFNFTTSSGDVHFWGVWWGKEPFERYNEVVGPFMSEYGFQSFPELETISSYAFPNEFDINSEVMRSHQRSPLGNGLITNYMQEMFNIPNKFEDFLYVNQLLQAEGIKTAIEAHRRNKPFCMGTLYWQLNDCWPVASWSSIDYYGRWKAQQYYAKRAFTDYMVSAIKDMDSIRVFVVNDQFKDVVATLQLSLIDFSGKVIKTISKPIKIGENSSSQVFAFKETSWIKDEARKNSVLNMKLTANKIEVTQNKYYFEKPKNLTLSPPKIKIAPKGTKALEISTDKLAKAVYLSIPCRDNVFADNFFDLAPGEKKIIELRTTDIKTDIKLIQVKTLVETIK